MPSFPLPISPTGSSHDTSFAFAVQVSEALELRCQRAAAYRQLSRWHSLVMYLSSGYDDALVEFAGDPARIHGGRCRDTSGMVSVLDLNLTRTN